MIKLFIKDDAFHPVRASEGNLLPCLHFYEANLNIICRRIDPVLGDFVYVSTFFGKWTCSAKKKSICISIKCITLFRMKGVHIMERFFKYNCKSETTCNPSNFCLLNKHWHSRQPSTKPSNCHYSVGCHCFRKIKSCHSPQRDPPQKLQFNE